MEQCSGRNWNRVSAENYGLMRCNALLFAEMPTFLRYKSPPHTGRPASAGFLLQSLLYPEDGGNIFLRNVWLSLCLLHCDITQKILFIDMAAARASNPTWMPDVLPPLNCARCFSVLEANNESRVGAVGVANGYGLDDRRPGFESL
jgi:hypothetical protein